MIQSILSNLAVILLLHLCIVALNNQRHRLSSRSIRGFSILFVSTAVIMMFYLPIQFGGYRFDLRMVPLVFLAVTQGMKAAIPALLITSTWRMVLGGDGAFPGIIYGMVLPTLFTLVANRFYRIGLLYSRQFYLFSFLWLISDFPIIFVVPRGGEVFEEIFLVRFISIVGSALLLNFFVIQASNEMRLKEQLQFYADHDPLTGLRNMRSFIDRATHFRQPRRETYIIMVDIDNFKEINDTYGHLIGDDVLKQVARIIQESGRDIISARYGGEEFILMVEADGEDEIIQVAENIRRNIEQTPFSSDDGTLHITVSIGIAPWREQDTLVSVIHKADQGLYQSKKSGKNRVHYMSGSDSEKSLTHP
ncbi:MAG: diguanylate cyclase [Bacillaceae bacterium]|nr:diguanylate cyclase [Bacillaceae bacterium]